jgi:hypothetical protein
MRLDRRRGMALLEALLALVLLTTAGLAWTALAGQASFALEQAQDRERKVAASAVILGRLEILTAPQLEAMVGRRRIDDHSVLVSRVMPSLYRIEIDVAGEANEWLETLVYRPSEVADAR